MKLISMSLYGSGSDYYSTGALENARLVGEVYPGWTLRVYCEEGHAMIEPMIRQGVQVVTRPKPSGVFGMSWRFEAVSDPEADFIIVRDIDSRLNVRERAAVEAWLASEKTGHIMRDHPNHTLRSDVWKMFGGMWGIKGNTIMNMPRLIEKWKDWHQFAADMMFLTKNVWPIIEHDHIAHGLNGYPFPPHPPYKGYVGQRYDANNTGLEPEVWLVESQQNSVLRLTTDDIVHLSVDSSSSNPAIFPIIIRPARDSWSYGGILRVRCPEERPYILKLRAQVTSGTAGFGLLNQSGTDFIYRMFAPERQDSFVLNLPILKPSITGALVVQNGWRADMTTVVLENIELLPADIHEARN